MVDQILSTNLYLGRKLVLPVSWGPFLESPGNFAARKAIAKSRLKLLYSHILRTEVPFIQEVSGVYPSPFLDADEADELKLASEVSGASEKQASLWSFKLHAANLNWSNCSQVTVNPSKMLGF